MNFGNAVAVVNRVVALTAEYLKYEYAVMVPGCRDRIYMYVYIRTCMVVVHRWGQLSVVQVVRYSPFEIA